MEYTHILHDYTQTPATDLAADMMMTEIDQSGEIENLM